MIAKPEPMKLVKARRDAEERAVEAQVRAEVRRRDGDCRVPRGPFGPCAGPWTWAHWGKYRRYLTRKMPPTERHQARGSIGMCQSHHELYDRHQMEIIALDQERLCNGPLEFRMGDTVWSEQHA